MLELQNLLCVVIFFLASPLYSSKFFSQREKNLMDQSKNEANLEVDFGFWGGKGQINLPSDYDQEYKESVKAILKQQYNNDVDQGKEAYPCHRCVFVFPQEKMFQIDHEHLCYECLYRFLPKANIPFWLVFRFQEFEVNIGQILRNEISFKDSSIIPQILGHGLLCATASLIYYDNFIEKFQNIEKTKNINIPPIIQLLQPIFFGYIYITSNIFAIQMYGSRMKHGEIPFSLLIVDVPCMKKNKNYSKHPDTGYPGFQLFLGFLVFMLYLTHTQAGLKIANWLLHIFMFWSAFSLWYERNSSFNHFGRYFSVFHDIQPQKSGSIICRGKPNKTIMRMAFFEQKLVQLKNYTTLSISFGSHFIFVCNQLVIFFNLVSSSILFDTLWNKSKTNLPIVELMVVFGFNMGMWYSLMIFSIVNMVKNKKQPALMTFNGFLRFIFAGFYAAQITLENNNYVQDLILVIISWLWIIYARY